MSRTRRAPGLAALALLAWPCASSADCFADLAAGAEAQRLGRLDDAEAIFRRSLEQAACRAPPTGPLLQFSLGQTLLAHGDDDPARACAALSAFTAAAGAGDPEVVEAARARIADADVTCRLGGAAPPDAPPAPRLLFGPRVEGGIFGLARGRFKQGTLSPGPALGLGLALQYDFTRHWGALLEPGVAFDSLLYTADVLGEARSVAWRRLLLEAMAGVAWHPDGGWWSLLLGARGGRVFLATEASTALAVDGADIELADWQLDGVAGFAALWSGPFGHVRASLTASLGALRMNPASDDVAWQGYRVVAGVAALF